MCRHIGTFVDEVSNVTVELEASKCDRDADPAEYSRSERNPDAVVPMVGANYRVIILLAMAGGATSHVVER